MSEFIPNVDQICESLGPDAWNKDAGRAPYGLNDIHVAVAEEAWSLIQDEKYEELGRLIAHYSTEYIANCEATS